MKFIACVFFVTNNYKDLLCNLTSFKVTDFDCVTLADISMPYPL